MPGDVSLPGAGLGGLGANSSVVQNINAQQTKAAPGYEAQQAYQRMNTTDQASIKNFYESYNNAYADPTLVQSIATNAGLNPQHAALALKYLALYDASTSHINAAANANNHSATLWGALTGAYHSITHAGLDILKWGEKATNPNNPNVISGAVGGYEKGGASGIVGGISGAASGMADSGAQAYGGFARGVASGVEGLANTGWDVAQRAGKTMYELAGGNGLHGFGDAFETLWHLALAPVNLINPWSQSNGYQLMAHTMAYYESVANKYGWDYAIGHAMPSIAAMFATDGVMGTGSVVAAGADDAALIKAAEQAAAEGKALTRAEKSMVKQARDRIAQRAEKSANFQKMRDSMDSRRAFVAKVAEHIPNPVSSIYRIARVAGKPMNDIRLNMAYQVTQAQAQKANPQLAKLWEDTRDGMVISHDGKPVDLGQQTAEYFGMHPNDMFFSPVSGITDLYTKYLGADPLGAAGKIVGLRKSYEGMTGGLGKWFRGIGIKSADDVYQLMNRSYVRRAFQFMADNGEGKIRDAFRGTYSDAVVKKLAKASTIEDVAKIHADLANGAGLIRYSLPTLTLYDDLKTTFITKLYGKVDVQTALASDLAFEESIIEQIKNATKRRGATGYDVGPKDGLYIQERDVALRWRTSFRRWCATQLVKRPMYYSELTKEFETTRVIPGDKNSIPAIMDMARAAMMPEDTVIAMGDFLSQSRTAEDFVNAYRQCMYHMVMRRAVTGLDHTALDSISKSIENHIWDEVNRIVGVDGGGLNGLYVNGQGNIDLSKVITSDMRDTAAAIDTTQLGVLNLPNARDLNALGRTVKNELTRSMPYTANVNDFSIWKDDVQRVAEQWGLTVKDARTQVKILSEYRKAPSNIENLPFGKDGMKAYEKANAELNRAYNASIKAKKVGAEHFANSYDDIRAARSKLTKALSFDKAHREDIAAGGKGEPGYKPLSKADIETMRGRLYAHEDHLLSMNVLMARENVVGPFWVKDWAMGEAKRVNPEDAKLTDVTNQFIKQMETVRANGDISNYRNNFQHVVDNINKGLSRMFVPLALLSGRWAMHVSASEAMLNSLRFGAFNFFDAKFASSIARHELNGIPLENAERSLIRDVLAGALLGFERSMLKGMSEAERMNMIDNFTGAIMRHNGHLPLGVHDQNTVYDPNVMFGHMPDKIADVSGETIESRKVYRTQDFSSLNNGQLGYAHGLTEALNELNRGKISPPILKELNALIEDKALFKTVNGRLVIKNKNNLEEALLPAALDAIHALPRDIYERFVRKDAVNMDWRTSATGARKDVSNFEFTKQHSEEDWARANIKNILGTISGTDRYGDVLHSKLLDQAISGEIAGGHDMANIVKGMKQAAPKDIVSRGFKSGGLMDSGMKSNFLIRVSNVGHDKILGPIVNNLVRNPTWLLEYHNQYEILRPLVDKGLMDEAHAEIVADSRATQNMAKFVHNPKDKTVWENNMRAAAPFYFAKNQAWRRAFRLFRNDPGAFEKYMKASLAVTDYIYKSTQSGTSPSVSIPGSEFMGFASASWLDGNIPGFSSLAFGLSGGPGSVTSVVPTGDMFTPWGLFGEFVRPPWGPAVTVPLKLIRYAFMGNNPTYNKFMQAALGHISSSTSWMSDLVPSGSVHDAAQIFLAGINSTNSSALSTENQVLNNAMDNMRAEYRKQISNEYDWSSMTKAQKELTINGLADQKVSEFFNDPLNKQRFLDQAKASSMLMLTVKSVLNFFSPMALSLNAQFSKVPEFNAIMQQKDPNTGQPYTFIAAAEKFAKEYPNNIYDLTAHTQSLYMPYPETTSALQLLENNPGLAEQYPFASAFLIPRSGQYSPQAYQLELSMGLRKRQAPADYLSGLLVATGDDYYYNYLKPSLMADPNNVQTRTIQNSDGTTTTIQDLNYTASKELKYAAKIYGDNSNPIWYEQFSGAAKKNAASQAITEMKQLLNDKAHDPFAAGEKTKFAQLVDEYEKTVTVLSEYRSAGNSSAYNSLYSAWYDYCTQISNNPYYAGQSYFITSALQKMPSQ